MRSKLPRAAAAFITALLLSGCLGVDTEPQADPETEAKLPDVVSAVVDGEPWSVEVNDTWFTVVDLNTFTIGGRNGQNYLGFRLREITRLGTYPIGGTTLPNVTVDLRRGGIKYSNAAPEPIGTLTVSELTPTRISGTFAFTAPRVTTIPPGGTTNLKTSIAVANGTFSIAVYPPFSVSITP